MVNTKTQEEKGSIISLIFAAIKVARPVHWTKNVSLFAAIFLSGYLFDKIYLTKTVWAFISFCFMTSATYIINDILDRNSDRLHPIKKHRPIASGSLPISLAIFEVLILVISSIFVALLGNLDSIFMTILIAYLLIQILYSLILKNVAILDIIIIATGFVLRVYAGAFVINAHLSVWFLLCVVSVALFLASGKRRAELNLVQSSDILTRKSLLFTTCL